MNTVKDMTKGAPAKLLFLFALPLMLGNVFQQLYTVVDTSVVGQALGVEALAALGATGWLTWLSMTVVTGITQGFSILISQKFGAGDMAALKKTVGASLVLSFIVSLALAVLMVLLSLPLLKLQLVPEEVIDLSALYLRIIYGGIPVTMAFNMFSGVLRALGDARTPLVTMIIASLTNIALDCIFIFGLGMGIGSAAAATLIAQAIAAVFCARKVFSLKMISLTADDIKPDARLYGRLLRLGLPLAAQNAAISIGGIYVQRVVDSFGVTFLAGVTATNTLYGVLETSAISYGYAFTTYAGQNFGAGKTDRVKLGVRSAIVISMLTSALLTCLMFLFGENLLNIFISASEENAEKALETAFLYLKILSIWLPSLYLLYVFRSFVQGMGNTALPMAAGMAELGARIAAAIILPVLLGQSGILYSEPIAWVVSDIIMIPGYLYMIQKIKAPSGT